MNWKQYISTTIASIPQLRILQSSFFYTLHSCDPKVEHLKAGEVIHSLICGWLLCRISTLLVFQWWGWIRAGSWVKGGGRKKKVKRGSHHILFLAWQVIVLTSPELICSSSCNWCAAHSGLEEDRIMLCFFVITVRRLSWRWHVLL